MGVNLSNVQGDILREFGKPHVRLVFFEFSGDMKAAARWLSSVGKRVPDTLSIINVSRGGMSQRSNDLGYISHEAWLHVSLSKEGIEKLGLAVPPSRRIYEGRGTKTRMKKVTFDPQDPFKEGMINRAYILGDTGPSACENWVEPYKSTPIDALFIVAADNQKDIDSYSSRLVSEASESGVRCVGQEKGATLKNAHGKAIEHFGFRDGVSQPLIIGIDDEEIGQRIINKDAFHPEDFVLFGLNEELGWANDGSFLAFRRLRQDVESFWNFMNVESKKAGLTPEALAAKFIGRWKSGASLAKHPDSDPDEGRCADENDFVYRQNGDAKLGEEYSNLDDVRGMNTPRFAHMRKANPRDDAMALDPIQNIEVTGRHRILRRPIPFGVPINQNPWAERGLLFICFQRDLEMQFEFIQTVWLNNSDFPIQDSQTTRPHGPDPITGRRDLGNSVNLLQKDDRSVSLGLKQWVTTTGGGYFFSPSISALRDMNNISG